MIEEYDIILKEITHDLGMQLRQIDGGPPGSGSYYWRDLGQFEPLREHPQNQLYLMILNGDVAIWCLYDDLQYDHGSMFGMWRCAIDDPDVIDKSRAQLRKRLEDD